MKKSRSNSIWGVVIANGKSEEIAPEAQTAFLQMGNQPILSFALSAFDACPEIDGVVVVADKSRLESIVGMSRLYSFPKLKKLVAGPINRCGSLRAAVHAIADQSPGMVVLHEASRPCVTAEMITQVVRSARRHGTSVAAERQTGHATVVTKGSQVATVISGKDLWDLQTPIAMKMESIHRLVGAPNSKAKPPSMTDAVLSERLYKGSRMVEIKQPNPKITAPSDIPYVSILLHV